MNTGENKLSAEIFEKIKQAISDEPYPVMFPEDVKMMRGMSDEITRKFQEYVESETGIPPYEMVTIDSVPELIKEQAEYDNMMYGDAFIFAVRPKKLITGCTQNFKTQALEAVFDILDADKPDRNGRIWQKELLTKQLMKPMWLIPPRHHKSWMWMKLLQMQSYEIQQRTLMNLPPSTKWDINSVIHMRWPKPDLSDLKHEVRKIDDLMVMDYITNTFGPIDQMTMYTCMRYWPELVKKPGPNLNDNKKDLERVIKKARRKSD